MSAILPSLAQNLAKTVALATVLIIGTTQYNVVAISDDVRTTRQSVVLKSGRAFRLEIEKQFAASWRNVPLRSVLRRVSEDREISILLDRRIDPSQLVTIEIKNENVVGAVRAIAKKANADVRIVGNTIYVGPLVGCEKLRTLIAIRSNRLESKRLNSGRKIALNRRRTVSWNDLDEPGELFSQTARRYSLETNGMDRVPHDLWAAATLPNANSIEALSLILIQFNLCFEWTESGAGVDIHKVPEKVSIERTYSVRRGSAQRTMQQLEQQLGDLQATVDGSRFTVSATVEQHEAIDEILNPSSKRPQKKTTEPISLDRQPFTFRASEATVISIMKKFEQHGIRFHYNAKKLEDAGVDLESRVSIDVSKVKADVIFRKLFDPLGLKFTIRGLNVNLQPK